MNEISRKSKNKAPIVKQVKAGQKERLRAALTILLEYIQMYEHQTVQNNVDMPNASGKAPQNNAQDFLGEESLPDAIINSEEQ